MRSKIFFLKGSRVEDFPPFSLFGHWTLNKFGQLVTIDKINHHSFRTLRSHIEQDDADELFEPEDINIPKYVNILLAAGSTHINGTYYFIDNVGKTPVNGQHNRSFDAILPRDLFNNLALASCGHPLKIIMIADFGAYLQNYTGLLPEGSMLITLSSSRSLINSLDFKHPDIRKLVNSLPESELKFEKLLQIYCLFQQFSYNEPLVSIHGMQGANDIQFFHFHPLFCRDLAGQLQDFPFFDTLFKQELLPQEVADGVINQLATDPRNITIFKASNLGNLGNSLNEMFRDHSPTNLVRATSLVSDKINSYKTKMKAQTDEQYYIPTNDKNLLEIYSIFRADYGVSGFIKLLIHKAMWEEYQTVNKSQPDNINIQDIGLNYRVDFQNHVRLYQNKQIIVGVNDYLYELIRTTGSSPFHYISKYGIAMSAIFEAVMMEAEQFLETNIILKILSNTPLMTLMKFLDQEDSDEENDDNLTQIATGSITIDSSTSTQGFDPKTSMVLSTSTYSNDAASRATKDNHQHANTNTSYKQITDYTSITSSVSLTSSCISSTNSKNIRDDENNYDDDDNDNLVVDTTAVAISLIGTYNNSQSATRGNNENYDMDSSILGHSTSDCWPFPDSY